MGFCITYSFREISVYKEDEDISNLHGKARAIDGGDENTVGMNYGDTIKDPQQTIQCSGKIWVGFELLYGFVLTYLHKGRAAS